MKAPALVTALEEALRGLGVRVRRERGTFRGGRCTVAGQATVVLNTLHPPEAQAAVLAAALAGLPHDGLYLRPAVRAAVEEAAAPSRDGAPASGFDPDGADPADA